MRSHPFAALAVATFALGCSGTQTERTTPPPAAALQVSPDDYVLSVPGMH